MSLRKDFGIAKPRIAVLGLNPHAGDNGLDRTGRRADIRPVITDQKNKGKLVYGPFPADGFFAAGHHSKYDGILAMYHDQGLIPFKTIAFEEGVNFTAGLPVVRTSPDHGTGYRIAGKNQANEGSLREAIYRAAEIFKHRIRTIHRKITLFKCLNPPFTEVRTYFYIFIIFDLQVSVEMDIVTKKQLNILIQLAEADKHSQRSNGK